MGGLVTAFDLLEDLLMVQVLQLLAYSFRNIEDLHHVVFMENFHVPRDCCRGTIHFPFSASSLTNTSSTFETDNEFN